MEYDTKMIEMSKMWGAMGEKIRCGWQLLGELVTIGKSWKQVNQSSFDKRINKMVSPHNGILFSHKME